jgi:hypothetical protein
MMWTKPFRDISIKIFDSPNSHFFIADCIVDFETGLIYKDGSIYWDAANENMVWYDGFIQVDSRWQNRINRQELIIERMKKQLFYFEEKIKAALIIPEIDEGTTLHLLHPFNRYVYGHIFDTLQKLYIIERDSLDFQSILIPNVHEIIDFDLHLDALSLSKKQIIHSDRGLVRVKQLLFINPVSHPTSFIPESYFYIRKKYFAFFDVKENQVLDRKIFLTRRPGKFKRTLLNDVQLECSLKNLGVLYFDGTETFSEVVSTFSRASHVAGVHGSLFTNNIFGHERTKYLEYCPANRENHTFHHQFKLCESYEHRLIGADLNHNIEISLDELVSFYNN